MHTVNACTNSSQYNGIRPTLRIPLTCYLDLDIILEQVLEFEERLRGVLRCRCASHDWYSCVLKRARFSRVKRNMALSQRRSETVAADGRVADRT